MLTKDDIAIFEKLLKPIRDSIDAIKSDIFQIKSRSIFKDVEERTFEDKLGAIQYDLEKIKEKLGI